jgi:replicative DNA helicase Mcm
MMEALDADVREWLNFDTPVFELSWERIDTIDTDLSHDVLIDPDTIIEEIEIAIEVHANNEYDRKERPSVVVTDVPESRLYDVGQFDPASTEGELVLLRGQVTNISKRRLEDLSIMFECVRCGTSQRVYQSGESMQDPYECRGCERQGPFDIDSRRSERVSFQRVQVQTLPEKTSRMASSEFMIELTQDLVGEVVPGDRAIFTVRMRDRRIEGTVYSDLFGDADSIELLDRDFEDADIEEYRDRVEAVVADEPFEALIETIAPTHHGDREIKLALALQMFGGVEKELPSGETKRGNIHLFLVGDPGVGKSALMDSVADISPRSVEASGQATSAVGLTAAAVPSDQGGGYSLKAGALVEADGGVACVDELDDMSASDRSGMLEAMSKQQVNVSKGGITATLPASCSVLAAANPKYGRFDEYESVPSQVDVTPQLLSRFDLVFTLRDPGDPDRDRRIAEHMVDVHRTGQRLASGEDVDDDSIVGRLSPEELRAYIAMGRSIVPVMSEEAEDRIPDSYVEMRQSSDSEAFSVGPRMSETVIRLSEASARVRLSEEITVDDMERALSIHRRYLNDFGIDPETGELDMDVVETGQSRTQHERVKDLDAVYRKLEASSDDDVDGVDRDELVAQCVEMGMEESKVRKSLSKKERRGEAYEPQTGYIRLF